MGIGSAIYGAIRLVWTFHEGGTGMAVLGLLTIVVGILLLINPLACAVVLPWIYGFSRVIGGVAALIEGFRMRSKKFLLQMELRYTGAVVSRVVFAQQGFSVKPLLKGL